MSTETEKLLVSVHVDSTPRGGVNPTPKCGNLRASTGISGKSTWASPPP